MRRTLLCIPLLVACWATSSSTGRCEPLVVYDVSALRVHAHARPADGATTACSAGDLFVTWKLKYPDSFMFVNSVLPDRLYAQDVEIVDAQSGDVRFSRRLTTSAPGEFLLPCAELETLYLVPHRAWRARVRVAECSSAVDAPAFGTWAASPSTFMLHGPRAADWNATWICTSPSSSDVRSSMLRTDFSLAAGKTVSAASVSVIGLGSFRVYLNGQPISADTNVPGWTTWSKRLLVSTYSVPLASLSSRNGLGVLLGNGMFNVPDPAPRYTKWTGSAGPRMLLLAMTIMYTDGSSDNVTTAPGAWSGTDGGPIVFTHQYAGEDFNATLDVPGWSSPGFQPATVNPLVQWAPAQDCSAVAPMGQLEASQFEPVQQVDVLPAQSIVPASSPVGAVIVDVGRNFAGTAEVNVSCVNPGDTLRVWPSETLQSGAINQQSGGTPMYWQYFVPTNASTCSNITLRPVFSTYGWRWLSVQQLPLVPASVRGDWNGTMTILDASYGVNCNPSLVGDETAQVAAWCNGTVNCSYQVCVCGDNTCGSGAPPCIPDPALNCYKNFSVTYRCTLDPPGSTRYTGISAEANNQIAALSCGPPPPPPAVPNVTGAAGLFWRSTVAQVGTWSSSSAWVNAIHNITVEAIASNLQSVLTDCPHRERLGWLEVSHLMFPSIAFNYDIHRLWSKIALDTVDSQTSSGLVPDIAPEYTVFSGGFRDSPEWGSASILNPYWLLEHYGNVAVVNATYETGLSYLSYLLSMRSGGLLEYGLSDWIPVVPSPMGVTATGTLVQDLFALATAATVLNCPADAANFTNLQTQTAAAYHTAFWDSSSQSYPTQATAGYALTLNITPAADVPVTQEWIVGDVRAQGNVTTAGEVGNRYALLALANAPNGSGIAAVWDSLLRTNAPGYGWMLTMGETALAESWFDAPQDSHIHAMYGHIDEFLYTFVAGIQRRGRGWRHVELTPTLPAGLHWLNATFESPRGRISCAARRSPTGDIAIEAAVPPGVEAWLTLPVSKQRIRMTQGSLRVIDSR